MVLSSLLMASYIADEIDRQERTYKDKTDDVTSTVNKRDLSRLVDLEDLEGDTSKDFKQRGQVDIQSLVIRQDDTFVTFVLNMKGDIGPEEQFIYQIAGYATDEPRSTDPYDFKIVFNRDNATYFELKDGLLRENGTVSSVEVNGTSLSIMMNRGNFILSHRSDPFLIAGIVSLDEGDGRDMHIDYVLTSQSEDDDEPFIDETTLIIIEFGILGFALIAVIIVWNVYMKRKGEEDQGGICPKCESRLDASLDFCPSCGTFIRGPNARPMKKREVPPPFPELEE